MANTGGLALPSLFTSSPDPGAVSDTTPFAPGQIGRVSTFYPQGSYWTTFAETGAPLGVEYILRSSTDAVTITTGSIAFWKSYTSFSVTADASDSYDAVGTNHCAGVFLGASPAAGKYGFIGVGGTLPFTLQTTPSSAADTSGKPIVASTADLTFDVLTAWGGAPRPVAVCLTTKNNPTGIGTDTVKGKALFVPHTVVY